MSTNIEETTSGDKAFYWALSILFAAFIIYVPFMYRDSQKQAAQLWQEQGCKMYDNYKPTNIPAACSNTFVDHYKPQDIRPQPPDINRETQ